MKKFIVSCVVLMFGISMPCYASTGTWVFGDPRSNSTTIEKESVVSAEVVKTVQEVLLESGFSCGTADGIIGENTITAIKGYQLKNDLKVTGEIDGALLEKMQIDENGNRIIVSVDDKNLELQAKIEELTAQITLLEKENAELKAEIAELKKSNTSETENTTKVYCIVDGCYKTAQHSHIGIAGQQEYYCAEHYQQMQDLLIGMFADVYGGN